MATINSLMRTEGSTKGARPDADRLVWAPLKLVGRPGTPAPRADQSAAPRAAERAAMRTARKVAAVVNTQVRLDGIADSRRQHGSAEAGVWKGRRMAGYDLTRAQIRRAMGKGGQRLRGRAPGSGR